MMREAWQRLSAREQRLVGIALALVAVAVAWFGAWVPMTADIARLARDVPRMEDLAARARAQADDLVALGRASAPTRGDAVPAALRVLAERNLRSEASGVDLVDGRVRIAFAMVRFDALAPLLDALARSAGLVATDIALQPRVEPGFVRAEITLSPAR